MTMFLPGCEGAKKDYCRFMAKTQGCKKVCTDDVEGVDWAFERRH
jgi:hypothetical protein